MLDVAHSRSRHAQWSSLEMFHAQPSHCIVVCIHRASPPVALLASLCLCLHVLLREQLYQRESSTLTAQELQLPGHQAHVEHAV